MEATPSASLTSTSDGMPSATITPTPRCHPVPGNPVSNKPGVAHTRQVPPEEVLPALAVDQLNKETMTTGVWLLRRCPLDDDFTDFTTGWYEWRADGTPPGVFDMVQIAVSRLAPPPPQIALSPPPPAPQLVWLPTWLWIDESTWGARSATASVPGVTVTATATPAEVTWSMGDGESRTCQGAGTPWSDEFDARASSPTCGYTYTTPSHRQAGGVYDLRATVTWQISWQAGGLEGTVSPLTTTSVASVEVVESLARNRGGQR